MCVGVVTWRKRRKRSRRKRNWRRGEGTRHSPFIFAPPPHPSSLLHLLFCLPVPLDLSDSSVHLWSSLHLICPSLEFSSPHLSISGVLFTSSVHLWSSLEFSSPLLAEVGFEPMPQLQSWLRSNRL